MLMKLAVWYGKDVMLNANIFITEKEILDYEKLTSLSREIGKKLEHLKLVVISMLWSHGTQVVTYKPMMI
jgi:hypothetical protein